VAPADAVLVGVDDAAAVVVLPGRASLVAVTAAAGVVVAAASVVVACGAPEAGTVVTVAVAIVGALVSGTGAAVAADAVGGLVVATVVVTGGIVDVAGSPGVAEQSDRFKGRADCPGGGGGGSMPGVGTSPAPLLLANDHPSTVPGGGVRFPAPKLLKHHAPPRGAIQ
jgi:hypothetical protein